MLNKPPEYWKSNPVLELIEIGENHNLEFKKTLEAGGTNPEHKKKVVHSALKTICAFLNSDGGTLILGVSDSGEIIGLEKDFKLCGRNKNPDGFELRLRGMIKERFEPTPLGNIKIEFPHLPEGIICKVDVLPSSDIVHLNDAVFVRDGNRTLKLSGPELTRWIEQRRQI